MEKRINSFIYMILLVGMLLLVATTVLNEPNKEEYLTVEVMAGDTLWSYAQEYETLHGMNTQSFIKWVERENNVFYGEIYPGETLLLPIKKKDLENSSLLAGVY